MGQLPPRAPTMAPHDISWPDFQSSTPEPTMPPEPNGFDNPTWVDDFVEFSSAKRKAHRRSISNPIPLAEEPTTARFQAMPESHAHDKGNGEFEGFEDEAQLIMSIFNNDLKDVNARPADSSSNPASSSGHGSSNPEKRCREERPVKSEHEEVESSTCKNENDQPSGLHPTPDGTAAAPTPPTSANNETIVDPKRVKRILANRQSAQRSRVRKLQYISELERSLTRLQAEVSMLSPRVAFLDRQRMILNVDNNALKAKIAALTQDKIFKDAHQEALKGEIERLKQVYHQQSVARAENAATGTPSSSPPSAGVAAQPH